MRGGSKIVVFKKQDFVESPCFLIILKV